MGEGRRLGLIAWLLALACGFAGLTAAALGQTAPWPTLKSGDIVLFRHANAPGGGDPPGFVLNECNTQRNLDELGRAQARRIGELFRTRRVKVGAVWTSQWCRTRETAELAFPGLKKDEPAFNSFFQDRDREPSQTARAKALLSEWRGPGVLVVVTHQVNITALTGVFPVSGEGIVVRNRGDLFVVVASLPIESTTR